MWARHHSRDIAGGSQAELLAYYDLSEYRRAIQDYDEAVRIDPGYTEAHANRTVACTLLVLTRQRY